MHCTDLLTNKCSVHRAVFKSVSAEQLNVVFKFLMSFKTQARFSLKAKVEPFIAAINYYRLALSSACDTSVQRASDVFIRILISH